MSASYQNSAWFYDRLSRLVFGRSLIMAQSYLLKFIPSNSNILIVGGGTGWVLEELAHIYRSGLNITYCEIASDMMARAVKRNYGQNKVTFITEAIEETCRPVNFDVVMTPFLFDNFTQQTFEKVFSHIDDVLKPGGTWLNCDFQQTGKWWQSILLRSMYLFFRLICGIEASRLPDIKSAFGRYGYTRMAAKTYYGNFIVSESYTKK